MDYFECMVMWGIFAILAELNEGAQKLIYIISSLLFLVFAGIKLF